MGCILLKSKRQAKTIENASTKQRKQKGWQTNMSVQLLRRTRLKGKSKPMRGEKKILWHENVTLRPNM